MQAIIRQSSDLAAGFRNRVGRDQAPQERKGYIPDAAQHQTNLTPMEPIPVHRYIPYPEHNIFNPPVSAEQGIRLSRSERLGEGASGQPEMLLRLFQGRGPQKTPPTGYPAAPTCPGTVKLTRQVGLHVLFTRGDP